MTRKLFRSVPKAGLTIKDYVKKGICVRCSRKAGERNIAAAGTKIFKESGLCEVCYRELFG